MDIFWLSLIQGLSEFFPVSSSGHLFIGSQLFGFHTAGRLTEVILNFATLLVVFVYFRTAIKELIGSIFGALKGYASPTFHQGLKICVATLPVICIGFLVHHYVDHLTHSAHLFGWVSIVFGLVMMGADLYGKHHTTYERITYKKAFLIGLFQAGAFIPGASRLGLSLTGARLLGVKRTDAAKFSFLTSIPVGIGALTLLFRAALNDTFFYIGVDFFVILFTCFCVGYGSLYFFMGWLRKNSLVLFGLYRILLGVFVLLYFHA